MKSPLDSNIMRPHADMATRRVSWGCIVLVVAVILVIVGVGYYFIEPAMRHNDVSYAPGAILPDDNPIPPACSDKVWPECVPSVSANVEKQSPAPTPAEETVLPSVQSFDPPVPPELIRYMVDHHLDVDSIRLSERAQWMNIEGRMDNAMPTRKSCIVPVDGHLTPLGLFNGRALAVYSGGRSALPDECTNGDLGFFPAYYFANMPGWYR